MRFLRLFPIGSVLLLCGCLLTSGQFLIDFELPNPIDVTSPTSIIPIPIDLNTIGDYNDHKEELKDIADLALLGEIENVGSAAIDVEFWMTPASTSHLTATAVRGDPTAVRVWGPFSLQPGQIRRIDWDGSAELFTGRQAVLGEVQGDGIFTLYALGPDGALAYRFILRQGVLVVVMDAAV